MFETNNQKFKKCYGPFKIDKDIEEITKCFFACGPHFPGVYGMMAYNTGKNAESFYRQDGFCGGGMIVFPRTIKLGLRDLSFVDHYNVEYVWNRGFGGKFPYRGNVYNVESLTLDIANMSVERITEIAKDIAHNQWDTDVLFKIFPSNRIFLVKSK
jgi:hypothetical protein